MKQPDDLNFEQVKIPADLKENLKNIKRIMNSSSDLLVNEIIISGHPSALICCEGMVSTSAMSELIFHPLMYMKLPENSRPQAVFDMIETKLLLSSERKFISTYGELMQFMMSGFAIIVTDGAAGAIALGAQGFERRGVSEPSMETNLKGSHEGFVETIRVNISLIRRKIKSPTMRFEMFQLGSRSRTDVCLAYLTDRVPNNMIKEIKAKLNKIKLETILSGGYVEPFLEGKHSVLFHNIGSTERPDVLCGKLLEGRAALIIDGTPFALIIPYLFIENFQTMDDYNSKPYYATFLRWIKYLAFGITILLPGAYVAIATFHPELFHDVLLLNLAGAEKSAPMPLMAEALIMLLLYEILREAGIRLPKAVGGAVSLVGGLIIGDAAVNTGLISTPLLLAVAMAVTASFVIPALNQSATILRFAFVLAGGTGGLFGVAVLLLAMLFNINSMEDFGIPAAAPVSPFTFKAMRDVIIRLGFRKMQNGDVTIEKLNGVSREVSR